ncbi:hypothetical protein [Mycoplasma sp. 1654_15]|uniref:hypothetical protein n=1 Tax=Mycoplasma sp. 1654_15 TaxID=2725994 RepID=UPI0014492E80|nr:hypothetical protein [Mycoplasma sp. 1654_15]QJB71113.1 hypothetical protein HF996_01210 [Mycoplasma sp. 1654_15]
MKKILNKFFIFTSFLTIPIYFLASCQSEDLNSNKTQDPNIGDKTKDPNNGAKTQDPNNGDIDYKLQIGQFDPNNPSPSVEISRQFKFVVEQKITYKEFKELFFAKLKEALEVNDALHLANPNAKIEDNQFLNTVDPQYIKLILVNYLIEKEHKIVVKKIANYELPWKKLDALDKALQQRISYQDWKIEFDDQKQQVKIKASFGHYHSNVPHIITFANLIIDDFKEENSNKNV